MKSTAFWVVTRYSVGRAHRFGETHRLYLQNRRLRQARNQDKQAVRLANPRTVLPLGHDRFLPNTFQVIIH
jgi:hypothetical protein